MTMKTDRSTYAHPWRRLLAALASPPYAPIIKDGAEYVHAGEPVRAMTFNKLERDGYLLQYPNGAQAWGLSEKGKRMVNRMHGPGNFRKPRKSGNPAAPGPMVTNGKAAQPAPANGKPVQPALVADDGTSAPIDGGADTRTLMQAIDGLAAAIRLQNITLNRIDINLAGIKTDTGTFRILTSNVGTELAGVIDDIADIKAAVGRLVSEWEGTSNGDK